MSWSTTLEGVCGAQWPGNRGWFFGSRNVAAETMGGTGVAIAWKVSSGCKQCSLKIRQNEGSSKGMQNISVLDVDPS